MKELICYCFGYTRKDIEEDYATHGRSLIMEKIKVAKNHVRCDCAAKNPKGR